MSNLTANQFNFAYLVDTSDSFGADTLEEVKDAFISLTQSLVDRGIADVSQFAVIPFNSQASLYAPLNGAETISTIEGLSSNGLTNINDALEKANQFFSTAPSGSTNIVYFASDGFNTGEDFTSSANELNSVADVRVFGIGAAHIFDLRIIDSNEPVIVSEAYELNSVFANSISDLVVADSEDGDNYIEVTSAPESQVEEENPSDNSNDRIGTKDEQNLVDDSGIQTPVVSEVDNTNKQGSNVDASPSEQLPVVNIDDVSIQEGETGISIAQLSVNLSSPATEEVQFSYETIDGTAISDSDYNQASGEITIPVGETSANISIEVNGDTVVEPNEEFTLNLKGLSGATFANNQAEESKVVVIENDDVAEDSLIFPQNVSQSTQIPDDGNILDENLLNLESYIGDVTLTFTVEREALLDNTVGVYRIENAQGTITDPITGNKLNPSDGAAYRQAALNSSEALELSVDNNGDLITIEDSLLGGYFYAPFIIAGGDFDSVEGDASEVYFSFAGANSDGIEHIRYENGAWGFEDLAGGGDNDFDDLVITAKITTV